MTLKVPNISLLFRQGFSARMSGTKNLILILVRHGETNSNKERRLQGQIDTELNETGIMQAKAAGKALQNMTFHKAYSSDLKRANKTCQLIVEENQSSPITAADIVQEKLLKERDFGELENKLITEWEAIAKAANKSMFDYNPQNGETRQNVRDRAREFLKVHLVKDADLKQDETPSILVVSHGGLIRELFTVIFEEMGCEYPASALPGDHKKLAKNTSWSRFTMDISKGDSTIENIQCQELRNADHLNNLD